MAPGGGAGALCGDVAVAVPAGAENGIDPHKERALCLRQAFKSDLRADEGRMPEAICPATASPCSWLLAAVSPSLLH